MSPGTFFLSFFKAKVFLHFFNWHGVSKMLKKVRLPSSKFEEKKKKRKKRRIKKSIAIHFFEQFFLQCLKEVP